MKVVKKTVNLISWVIYIAIFLYLVLVAPVLLGYKPVVVLSGSMEPAYHVGSVIYYKETAFEDIQKGDAITFKIDGGSALVTHRVVEKNEISRNFVTKGDANSTNDSSPVDADAVAGKAAKISIPYAGYYVMYGKQLPVIIVAAAIIILSIALDSLYPDPKKKGKKERAENNEEKPE